MVLVKVIADPFGSKACLDSKACLTSRDNFFRLIFGLRLYWWLYLWFWLRSWLTFFDSKACLEKHVLPLEATFLD